MPETAARPTALFLCDVRCEDFGSADVLAGAVFQEKYESQAFRLAGGRAAGRHLGRVQRRQAPPGGRLPSGFAAAALRQAMPELGKRLKGFDSTTLLYMR